MKNNFFSTSIQKLAVAILLINNFTVAQTKWADWNFVGPQYDIIWQNWNDAYFSSGTPLQNGVSSLASTFGGGIVSENNPGGGFFIPVCSSTVNTSTSPYIQYTINHSASSIDFTRFVIAGITANLSGYSCGVELRWNIDNYATAIGSKTLPSTITPYNLISYDLSSLADVTSGSQVIFRLYFKGVTTTLPVVFSNNAGTNYDSTPAAYTTTNKAVSVWYNSITIPVPSPTITSFSPSSGTPGTPVIITGTGFNTTLANNIVRLNGMKCTVTNATATSLTVTVPSGTGYGKFLVTNLGTNLSVYSKAKFAINPTYSNETIYSNTFKDPVILSSTLYTHSTSNYPNKFHLVDVDDDGNLDIAYYSANSYLNVLKNNYTTGALSSSSFSSFQKTNNQTDWPTSATDAGKTLPIDLNNDGKIDFVGSSSELRRGLANINSSTSGTVSFNNFSDIRPTGGSRNYWGSATLDVFDFNNDGKQDFLGFATASGPGYFYLSENTSTAGNFTVTTGNNSNTYQQSGVIASTLPVLTETFDVDGDGKIDYVFGETSNLKVLKNTSNQYAVHNNFTYSVSTIATGVNVKALVYSDINNDTKQDIFISEGNNVKLYINTSTSGTISFDTPITVASTLNQSRALAIADIDGDGKLDVVVTDANSTYFIKNTTTSTPTFATPFLLKNTAYDDIKLVDLDKDGKVDILGTNSYILYYLRNQVGELPILTVSSNTLNTITNCKTPRVIADHSNVTTDFTLDGTDMYYVADLGMYSPPLTWMLYKNTANSNYYITAVYQSNGPAITSSPTSVNNLLNLGFNIEARAGNFPNANLAVQFNQATGEITYNGTTVQTLPKYESFTVSGTNFSADLTITPTVNFQVSTDQSTWRGTTTTPTALTLTPSSGTVASSTVYVRTTPSIAANSYSGSIAMATTGATSVSKVVAATLYAPTAITTQPVATKNLCLNASTGNTLTIVATGTGLTYQWYSNTSNSNTGGTSLGSTSGAATATLTLSTASAGTNYYYCVVTGSCGVQTSIVSTVTIDPISVAGTATPSTVTLCSGNTQTLTLSGSTGSIQWQQSANGTTGWANVTGGTGATTASYTTPVLTNTTYYKAIVTSGACTSATSNTVTITVSQSPTITLSNSISTSAGLTSVNIPYTAVTNSPTTYSVVSGTNALANFTAIVDASFSGASGNLAVTLPANTSPGTYDFNVTVKNASGCSSMVYPVTLTIFAPPPTITSFSPTSAQVGETVTITGTRFSSIPTNNIVYFGSTKAVVNTATSTQLEVSVPKSSVYAPITVISDGLMVKSNNYFRVINNPISPNTITNNKFGNNIAISSTPGWWTSGWNDMYIAVGDFDNDNKVDVVKGGSSQVRVHRNLTTGPSTIATSSFNAGTNFAVTGRPRSIIIEDINSDGKLDIITGSDSGVSILINTSTGSGSIAFATAVNIASSYANTIRAADFDLDGRLDLATIRSASIAIYRNTSTSSFSLAAEQVVAIPTLTNCSTMGVGDMNKDTKPDVIVSNSANTTILLNNSSSGSISFPTNVALSGGGGSLVIADMDNDADLDMYLTNRIIVNNYSTGTISSSNFSSLTYSVDGGSSAYSVSDLNGDGKLEVIGGTTWDANYLMMVGSLPLTTSSLTSTSYFLNKTYGYTAGIGLGVDVDGDEKVDFLSAANYADAFSVTQNLMTPPPVIAVSGSLTAFTKCAGVASAAQTFTVSGNYLTANIDIAAITGYEYSLNGTTYSSTLSIAPTSQTVAATSVYVRLTAASTGSPAGTISISSTGAVTQTVAISGTVLANQSFGNALAMNGSGKIQFANQAQTAVSVNFTVEAWVNVPSSASNIQTIISNYSAIGTGTGFRFGINTWNTSDGKIVFEGGSTYVGSSVAISKNVWQHVAVVVNNSVVSYYINGNLVGTSAGSFPAISSSILTLGAFSDGQYLFNGMMDEVRLWNTAKTQQEILASMYTPLAGTETNLVAYFNFNQGIPGGTNTGIANLIENGPNALTASLSEITRTGTAENFVANTNPMAITGSLACVGSTVQLYHPQTGGTWSSATTSVATITSTGLVSCITTGSSVISYTYTYNGCQFTDTYTLTVNATPVAPTVANTTIGYCQNATATALTATAAASHTLRWYTVATGGTGSTTAITPITTATGTFTYYVAQANASGCEGPRVAITVTVSPPSVAGTASASATSLCPGNGTTLTLTGNTGTIQWQSSLNNSTWTNITGATSATYTTPNLSTTTYYRAAVSSGACTVANSNVVTITVPTAPYPYDRAVNFTNAGSLVRQTTTSLNFTNFTVEAWIYPTTFNNWAGIVSKGAFQLMTTNTGTLAILFEDGWSWSWTQTASPVLSLNQWQHVAASYNASTKETKLYVNGTLVLTWIRTQSYVPNFSASALAIGTNNGTGNQPSSPYQRNFIGNIDEVKLWNAVRTDAQILANYATELAGNETGLVAYYKFNQGIGAGNNTAITSLTDLTANANHLTPTSMTMNGATNNIVQAGPAILNSPSICLNDTPTLTHNISGGTWASSDATIISVDSNTGAATANAVGTATITYSFTDNGCSYSSTKLFTVNPLPAAPVTTTTVNLCQGITATALTATATTGNTLQWYTVATAGTASTTAPIPVTTAVGQTIYYVSQKDNTTGCEGSRTAITVNVNALPTITGVQNMTVGGSTLQLTGSGTPHSTTPWTSSNLAVATISSSGVVSSVGSGSTTITYTTTEGCSITATINVVDCNQPFGNALGFGVGTTAANADYVQINSRIFPSQSVANFTIETWVKPAASDIIAGTPGNTWLSFLGYTGAKRSPSLYITNNGVLHASWTEGSAFNGSAVSASSPTTFIANKWTHVALVKDGTTMRVYVDGNQLTSLTCLANLDLPDNAYWLGKSDQQFSGALDEVRFWSTARTQTQIQSTMNTELAGNETGLLAYFDFNQGVAGGTNTAITTLINKANNAINGTLTNFTKTGTASNFVGSTNSTFSISGAATMCANSTAQYTHQIPGGTWTLSNGANATVSATGLVTSAANETVTLSYAYTLNGCAKTDTKTITIDTPASPAATTTVNLCQGNATTALTAIATTGNTLQWYTAATGGTASTTAPTPSSATIGTTIYYVSQKSTTTNCESPRTAISVNVYALSTISGNSTVNVGSNTTFTATNSSVTSSALNFDGSDDYATAPAGVYFDDNTFTIEGWVNLKSHAFYQRLIDFGNGPDNSNVFFMLSEATNGKPGFGNVNSSGQQDFIISNSVIPLNQWVHVAAVRDGSFAAIYINGVLTASSNSWTINTENITRTNCLIGKDNWGGITHLDGSIGELRFWTSARTLAQIQATMNTPVSPQSDLRLLYKFDQGVANQINTGITTITDQSGANYSNGAPANGTLTNFALTGSSSNWTYGRSAAQNAGWSSSDTTVATVDVNGIVTGVAAGTTTITYTNYLGCTTTKNLSVVDCAQPFGNALNFDGVDDYLVIDNVGSNTAFQFANTTNYTLEAWVNRTAISSNEAIIISKQNGGVAGNYSLGLNPAGIPYLSREYAPWAVFATTSLPLNEWHHIAGVFDGTSLKIYIDGVLNNSIAASGSIMPSTVTAIKVNIGSMYASNSPSKFFKGSIDEVRVWNIARTATQIQQSFITQLQGNESNLVGYYNFNQGVAAGNNASITSATNTVSSVSNGVLTNFAKSGTTSNFVGSTISNFAITGAASICTNSTSQYTHSIPGGTWSINNGAVATVNSTGLVTSIGVESATLSYTYTLNGCSFTATKAIDVVETAITAQPSTQAQNVCINGVTASLSVTATGVNTTYQWYKNTTASITGGTLIAGATSSVYMPSNSVAGTTYYYCVVGGSCLPAATSAVSGAITIYPASVSGTISGTASICSGATTTLTLTGNTGTIQWQRFDNPIWTDLTGETNATFTTPVLTQNTTYRVAVTSGNCSVANTTNFNVIVNPLPVISGPTSVGAGETITMTATTAPASSNPWTSSNSAVASVSNTGIITGLTMGSTTITFTNSNGCTDSEIITVGLGTTQPPVLTSPVTNTTGATTLNFNYTLPETPLAGSVTLIFTPTGGGTPIVWTMTNATSAVFSYVVGTNPTLISNVISGTALGFTTYDVTLAYQDAFSNPTASVTNTNIQTLAPPSISFANTNYSGLINQSITIQTVNVGGGMVTYSIVPTLPAGLSLNASSGLISGTPTVTLAQTLFTVTATNAAGTDTETFNLFIDADTDGDGIGNTTDPDIDGDGTLNGQDSNPTNPCIGFNPSAASGSWNSADCDNDGIPNGSDSDVDGNGTVDNGTDTDGDGINDANDPDIDGDGIPNGSDSDPDGNGTINNGPDTDGDGINDANDPDIDGDGIPNGSDSDPDGNGTINNGPDTDGDGINDANDPDIDGDGIPNGSDSDANGDGTIDNGAVDTDGDGIVDGADSDANGDGVIDNGPDTDGDGVNDANDPDIDGDGIPNGADVDPDGDGTNNNGTDTDGDGINDANDPDIDGDGIPNGADADPDGNGTVNNGPDTDGDGINDANDPDIDGDGIPNGADADPDGDGTVNNGPDTDGDGINDAADADPDGDGTVNNGPDTDGDGVNDSNDPDVDGDGIPNGADADPDGNGTNNNGTDMDGDGVNDANDSDIDGDGIPNGIDNCPNVVNPSVTTQPNTQAVDVCPSTTPPTLTVQAVGQQLEYQWYVNTTNSNIGGTAITGATAASYIPSNTLIGPKYYYVIVFGTCGIAKSNVSGAITVQDITPPTVIAQNISVALNASGNATITAAQINNGSTDNCNIATMNVVPNTFTCANIGTNTVTLTIIDASGNSNTASAIVTVTETILPVVVTQNVTVNLNSNGQATITAAQINNGSSDNCGIANISVSPSTFTCANVGPNTVTLTVTDVNGNVKTGTAIVTVSDITAPTVQTQNVSVTLNAQGTATVTAAQVNNGSIDNCSIATMTVFPNSFTCANIGANTVTLTVTDVNGNVSTGTAVVTVILDNSVTGNNDLDALPDNCDDDDDNDGILDVNDNCQFIANQNQLDTDSDGIGDICDPDDDNDGVSDGFDNCPLSYNPYQDDRDNDGLGDVCDTIEINVSDAISPNGDGVNDVWIIYNIENHPNNIVRVFNRWGKEVFKARKYQNNWGGEFGTNPETLPEGGSYYYQIDLDGDGTIDNEGWLYISRK